MNTREIFTGWKEGFISDANADNCREFRELQERLNIVGEPEATLEGTVQLVLAAVSYLEIDGQSIEPFLALQQYRPTMNGGSSTYSLLFDLCGKAYGRLITDSNLNGIDFADLLNHPWEPYKVAGYSQLLISRVDGACLESDEVDMLDNIIRDDIYYDFDDDEVEMSVSLNESGTAVIVDVVDIAPGIAD